MSVQLSHEAKEQKPVVAAVQGDSPQSSTGGTTSRKGQGGARSEASTRGGIGSSTVHRNNLYNPGAYPAVGSARRTRGAVAGGCTELMKAFMQQTAPTTKAMRVKGMEWDALPALRELDAGWHWDGQEDGLARFGGNSRYAAKDSE